MVVFPVPTSAAGPWGIAAGPDDNVWFTELDGNQIGRITPQGDITEFPVPSEGRPRGITAGPDGNLWFTEHSSVGRITPEGEITEFPLPGESSGGGGITQGPDGNLWFTENQKIGRITPEGEITEFPLAAESRYPQAIALGPDGNLWFTEDGPVDDPTGARIGRITPDGQVTEFPLPAGSLEPQGIVTASDGKLWFTNAYQPENEPPGRRLPQIGHITPAGDVLELPIVESWEQQIATGPDVEAALWVAGVWADNPVVRINLQGQTTGRYRIPIAEPTPESITAGPDGNMWVTLPWRDAIARVTPGPRIPINLAAPSVSGEPEPRKVLSASPGSWTERPSVFSYRWERCRRMVVLGAPFAPSETEGREDCSAIDGATGSAYAVTKGDDGYRVRVRVTAFNDGVESDPATSAPSELVGLHLRPNLKVTASVRPGRLPRDRQAPARLHLGFSSTAFNPPGVPQLSSISLELARNVQFHAGGLESCPIKRLYVRTALARHRCAGAVVGHGTVRSEVTLSGEDVQVEGVLTAFYERNEGQPRILAQVTTGGPTPLIYILPFRIDDERGRFGTSLVIPEMRIVRGIVIRGGYRYTFPYSYGRISHLGLLLNRSFARLARRRSFVTASCPAPRGAEQETFPLLRAKLGYAESYYRRSRNFLTRMVRGRCRASG